MELWDMQVPWLAGQLLHHSQPPQCLLQHLVFPHHLGQEVERPRAFHTHHLQLREVEVDQLGLQGK